MFTALNAFLSTADIETFCYFAVIFFLVQLETGIVAYSNDKSHRCVHR
uniref:SSD domain-containing protein n=1 Tax=Ascaris lumbricoides TaxID=6252 RepID=A0A0M3HYJ0_ASCLU